MVCDRAAARSSVAAREQLGITNPGREPNQSENDSRLKAHLPVSDMGSDSAAQVGGNHEQAKRAGAGVSEQERADNFENSNKSQPAAGESDQRHLRRNLGNRY